MTNSAYTIHRKTGDNIYAEFDSQTPNTITRGENAQFQFWLADEADDVTFTEDTTLTRTQVYSSFTVESGVTLTVESNIYAGTATINGNLDVKTNTGLVTLNTITNPFATLLQYGDWAGKFSTLVMLDGTEKYREQIPTSADVDSIVLGIEPSSELKDKDVTGIWGILTDMQDARNPSLSIDTIQLSLRVLAEFDEYADHTALENDLLV